MAQQDVRINFTADTRQARNEVDKLKGPLKDVKDQADRAGNATENFGKQTAKNVVPLKSAGLDMRNLSYQIQDVAVQASMGTDSLRILTMQGPQIASAFGPAGAAYGAVIAIAGAVGGALLPSLLNGKDAIEELNDTLDELSDYLDVTGLKINGFSEELIQMARVSRPAAIIAMTHQIGQLQEQIDDANESIQDIVTYGFLPFSFVGREIQKVDLRTSNEEIEKYRGELQEFANIVNAFETTPITESQLALEELYGRTSQQRLKDYIDQLSASGMTMMTASEQIEKLREGLVLLASGEELVNNQSQNAIKIYTDRLMALRLTNEEMDIYRITSMDISNADKLRLLDIQTLIDKENELTRVKETQHNALMSFSNDLLANESKNTQAMARMGINLLDQEKRQNAAKILSDSYTAAMSAYKALAGIPIIGPALGAVAAGTILAAGVSYSAKSLQGRALGGQVRGGESYIVGERGPEVLTMGSSRGFITPNDQLRSQTVNNAGNVANVTFNITANDTAGFDELLNKRRGQIIGIVNQALNNSGRRALV